jgi:hypothetical protein
MNSSGTHKGEFQGFITLQDGKITEEWVNADTIGLMQQIGTISLP